MGGCLQQRPPGWAWGGEEGFVSLLTFGPIISGRYYADIRQTIPASDQEMNSILAELSRVWPCFCFLGWAQAFCPKGPACFTLLRTGKSWGLRRVFPLPL